jgi:hypothetical protein
VLVRRNTDEEFNYPDEYHDYGYFERIENAYGHHRWLVFVGGCHTIGVTGAARAFSVFSVTREETRERVLHNAAALRSLKRLGGAFAVVFQVQRVGATIATPEVKVDYVI